MSIEMKNKYGQIDISTEVIATIAGGAAIDCYGIIGMASRKRLKDGITELLGRDNFSRELWFDRKKKKYILICTLS